MKIHVERVSKEDWAMSSEEAHLICFGKHKPQDWDRIDYALVAVDHETQQALGYVTVREHDAHSAYWQFGGVFPGTRHTHRPYWVFKAFLRDAAEDYQRVNMLIENTNAPMLKGAQKAGFLIVGVRVFNGHILLEHLVELQGGH